ncbi:MAG: hypothetical protein RR312_09390 [Bacteroidales bacterium]
MDCGFSTWLKEMFSESTFRSSFNEQKQEIDNFFGKDLKYHTSTKDGDTINNYYVAMGWFFIFSLRIEFACDSSENCQFPYANYDKYLTKRNQNELIEYINWNDERVRSKNAMNQLKIELQINFPKQYKILVKNEADIRMASSSWIAATVCLWPLGIAVSIYMAFLLIKLFYANDLPMYNNIDVTVVIISIFLSLMMLALNIYIKKSILIFIHYQRLREIFFTLKVFDVLKKNRKGDANPNF